MKFLDPLLQIYQVLGAGIPAWTQAQGSNLSFKDSGKKRLWIKPSGYKLNEVRSAEDLVEIDMDQLPSQWQNFSQNEYSEVIRKAKVGNSQNRPSMETGFHVALAAPYVLHFHSLVSILMGHQKEQSEKWLQRYWGAGDFYYSDYVTPGLDLTIEVASRPEASLFFLKQHGIILAGNEPSILQKWMNIEKMWMKEFYGTQWPLELSSAELMNQYSQGPLKVLFPDMAVFLEKMPQILEPQGNQWKLKKDAEKINSNLVDLWIATQVLLRFESSLAELSQEEVQKITGLPTEQYRLLVKS